MNKTICCKKTSPCDSCDPANGSCLPSLGKCGLAGGEQRVVGGQDALPGEFPFTALLGRKVKLKTRGVVVDKYISPSFVCRHSSEDSLPSDQPNSGSERAQCAKHKRGSRVISTHCGWLGQGPDKKRGILGSSGEGWLLHPTEADAACAQ